MGLALDEPKEDDMRFEQDELLWVMTAKDQQDLLTGAQGFRVDYVTSGWGGAGYVVSRVGGGRSCC